MRRAIFFNLLLVSLAGRQASAWGVDQLIYSTLAEIKPQRVSIASDTSGARYAFLTTGTSSSSVGSRVGLKSVDDGATWDLRMLGSSLVALQVVDHHLVCVNTPDSSYLLFSVQTYDSTRDSLWCWLFYADTSWQITDSVFVYRFSSPTPWSMEAVVESGICLSPWGQYDVMSYSTPYALMITRSPIGSVQWDLPGDTVHDEYWVDHAFSMSRNQPTPGSARVYSVYSMGIGQWAQYSDNCREFTPPDSIPYWYNGSTRTEAVAAASGGDAGTVVCLFSKLDPPFGNAIWTYSLDAGVHWQGLDFLAWGTHAFDAKYVRLADKFSLTYGNFVNGGLYYAQIERSTLVVSDYIPISDPGHPTDGGAYIDVIPGTSTLWTAFVDRTTGTGIYTDEETLPQSAPPTEPTIPSSRRLRVYPNPFNARTVFAFTVDDPSEAWVDVYDVLGRKVGVLGRAFYPSGEYEAPWDAGGLPSGLYIAVLRTEYGIAASTKVTLLK